MLCKQFTGLSIKCFNVLELPIQLIRQMTKLEGGIHGLTLELLDWLMHCQTFLLLMLFLYDNWCIRMLLVYFFLPPRTLVLTFILDCFILSLWMLNYHFAPELICIFAPEDTTIISTIARHSDWIYQCPSGSLLFHHVCNQNLLFIIIIFFFLFRFFFILFFLSFLSKLPLRGFNLVGLP